MGAAAHGDPSPPVTAASWALEGGVRSDAVWNIVFKEGQLHPPLRNCPEAVQCVQGWGRLALWDACLRIIRCAG